MAAGDLTTLADVRDYLQRPDDVDTEQDALISTLITIISREISRYTGQEFAPAVSNASRKFVYRGGSLMLLAPYSLRSVTSIVFDTDGTSPGNQTITADQYRLFPREPQDGVYTHVEFRNLSPATRTSEIDYRPSREVTITGAWGYPAIPDDVEHACTLAVVFRLRNDSDYRSQGGGEDIGRYGAVQLPTLVKQILEPYRIRSVG